MTESAKLKLKLLYITDILTAHSDDEHPLTAAEICAMLAEKGIEVHRKTVYRDIKLLQEYGLDIVKVTSPRQGFVLGSRTFELPEIRLLIDAVQAAPFVTPKKTKELIAKLERFLSRHQAETFSRQIFMDFKAKYDNEEIFYTIDVISQAISERRRVKLRYQKRLLDPNFAVRHHTREFTVSPYALIWSGDRYYLVCNVAKYDNLMHLRVDRVRSAELTEEEIRPIYEVSEYTDDFDGADYSSKIFNMFGGEEDVIELRCKNRLLESVMDRFGPDIPLRKSGNEHFALKTRAIVSEGLESWILQYGDEIEVFSPRYLRERMAEKVEKMLSLYRPG